MTKNITLLTSSVLLAAIASPVQANEKGDWLVRVGVAQVDPKSGNNEVVSVDSGTAVNINGSYFLSSNLAVEVLASTPFSHDIKLADGGAKVGETKHLPPTVSLQYHFNSNSAFRPYVGAGVNYTLFFDEETTGALEGTSLELDGSLGLAAQIGADFDLNDNMFLNFDLRWIDIDTDASIPEAELDLDVEIDPLVYSVTLGWRF